MTVFGYTFPKRFRFRRRRGRARLAQAESSTAELTLERLPVGQSAQVEGFLAELPPERRIRLQSYGLVPGAWVLVLQHAPVTVVQIEHLELALENNLASKVRVRI